MTKRTAVDGPETCRENIKDEQRKMLNEKKPNMQKNEHNIGTSVLLLVTQTTITQPHTARPLFPSPPK